jgi:hypothetical protein
MTGNQYRDLIARYIDPSGAHGLVVYTGGAGKTIIGKDRMIDVFVVREDRSASVAIECKYQGAQGTVDERPAARGSEALWIPGLLVYAGGGWSRGAPHPRGLAPRRYCLPDVADLERRRDTRELDHVLAATFGLWNLVILPAGAPLAFRSRRPRSSRSVGLDQIAEQRLGDLVEHQVGGEQRALAVGEAPLGQPQRVIAELLEVAAQRSREPGAVEGALAGAAVGVGPGRAGQAGGDRQHGVAERAALGQHLAGGVDDHVGQLVGAVRILTGGGAGDPAAQALELIDVAGHGRGQQGAELRGQRRPVDRQVLEPDPHRLAGEGVERAEDGAHLVVAGLDLGQRGRRQRGQLGPELIGVGVESVRRAGSAAGRDRAAGPTRRWRRSGRTYRAAPAGVGAASMASRPPRRDTPADVTCRATGRARPTTTRRPLGR